MQSKPYRPNLYLSSEIKKLKQNPKKYHELLKQFLTHFKVHKCCQQSNHNLEMCFFHHDQNDRRRNPYLNHEFLYSNFNLCKCGQPECTDFFNEFEHVYHPLSYKITQCVHQSNCEAGFFCPYIHPDDLIHFEYGEFFRFDLRTFKTIKCMNKHPHERKTCLYYHNDKDKRRPSNIQYNHFICAKQKCNSEQCQFSHNKLQQLYHPNRYKTKFCQFYPNNIDKCEYKSFCSFAHTQNQIIQNIELIHLLQKNNDFYLYKYKTVWCPFTQNHQRDKCPYAHNIQDYRRNPKQYDYEPVRCDLWNFSDQIKSIEGAGCKRGMQCKKCHGWMEQRYHPSKYNAKRSKSLRKEDYEAVQIIVSKKLPDFNLLNEYKNKGKGNTNPQILKGNYSKGTPFFKNDKYSEYSAKTKARSNNFQSDKSIDGSSNKEVQKTNDNINEQTKFKNIFLYSGEGEGEEELFINWSSGYGKKQNQQDHKQQQNSARSKSAQKSEEYAATFSTSIKSVVQDDQILSKLRKEGLNEIQIVNMDQSKIDKCSFLNYEQKRRLAMKLRIYSMKQTNAISYSKELTKYFIAKKRDGILQKMQQKRVKQAKLLKLAAKQINQLSFLEVEEKAILPKLLKEYRSDKQFKQLSMSIEKETKMK